MNKKTSLLVGACILQVLVLLCMVIGVQSIYLTGETYSVKATGYDPYDPLRGRYIRLRIEEVTLPLYGDEEIPTDGYSSHSTLYAVFDPATKKLAYCTFRKPERENYLKVESWYEAYQEGRRLVCYFNEEDYYVNEKMAQELERKIGETDEVYLVIQLNKGFYVVKELVIDGVSY